MLLIVAALVALSAWLEVDILLGAFTAGIIWQLLIRDASHDIQEAVLTVAFRVADDNGLLLLEMVGPDAGIQELSDKLNAIDGVEVQSMVFFHLAD